ncbi:hypothetical protein GJQ54_02390 [Oceanospirillaceae bacterium ASx5O]|nr:hypothetical protein GJQ54_02390 [Oceanospirillaceae bacterium ASx5O]
MHGGFPLEAFSLPRALNAQTALLSDSVLTAPSGRTGQQHPTEMFAMAKQEKKPAAKTLKEKRRDKRVKKQNQA